MNDKVRGLVEKWRNEQIQAMPAPYRSAARSYNTALQACANELEQALAAPAEGAGHWAMELAREIKANAEDHPEDYISKFALQWADQLAARAVTADGAEVVAYRSRNAMVNDGRWDFASKPMPPGAARYGWEEQRLIVHPADRAATQEVGS